MTCLFFHLATHPEVYKTLQSEVYAFLASESDLDNVDGSSLASLPYLQACIDESLGVYPPVASG